MDQLFTRPRQSAVFVVAAPKTVEGYLLAALLVAGEGDQSYNF